MYLPAVCLLSSYLKMGVLSRKNSLKRLDPHRKHGSGFFTILSPSMEEKRFTSEDVSEKYVGNVSHEYILHVVW